MVSKTKLNSFVREFNWKEVQQGLDESPDLIEFRDDKGRSFLHICCMTNIKKHKRLKPKDSIRSCLKTPGEPKARASRAWARRLKAPISSVIWGF